jgi:CHASE3 domain sensor protein
MNKTRSWFFEKNYKRDKPLTKIIRGHRDSIQRSKIRNEKEDITSEIKEIRNIIRSYYKSLSSTKLENLGEMDDFLGTYQETKSNQDQINHLKSPIISKEIEAVINSSN